MLNTRQLAHVLSATALSSALVGCANQGFYRVTLEDGRTIEANGWPRLNETTGYYRVEDQAGQLRVFREQEVGSIVTLKPDQRR